MTTATRARLSQSAVLMLTMLVAAFLSVVALTGVSYAQDAADDCYPVPPGGCEVVQDDCSSIIAAIESGDTSLDQNGDGEINADDLPAECTCAELLDAISRGVVAIGDLPADALADCTCPELLEAISSGTVDPADIQDLVDGACSCDEIQEAIDAADLDESALPEDCGEEEAEEQPEADELAVGGFPTTTTGAMALAVVLAGVALLAVTRKQA